MNLVHEATRISHFLNRREEAAEGNDDDILADIGLTYSVEEVPAHEPDDEDISSRNNTLFFSTQKIRNEIFSA
jgi:hypothetical protein